MTGDKIPYTKTKAVAYMMYNVVRGNGRRRLKKMARREKRHYELEMLEKELT